MDQAAIDYVLTIVHCSPKVLTTGGYRLCG
jgi:hypothetical protein